MDGPGPKIKRFGGAIRFLAVVVNIGSKVPAVRTFFFLQLKRYGTYRYYRSISNRQRAQRALIQKIGGEQSRSCLFPFDAISTQPLTLFVTLARHSSLLITQYCFDHCRMAQARWADRARNDPPLGL